MIHFSVTKQAQNSSYDCLCIGMYRDRPLEHLVVDKVLHNALIAAGSSKIIEQGDFKGKLGQTHLISGLSDEEFGKRILLVGLGKFEKMSAKNYEKVIDAMIGALKPISIERLGIHFCSQFSAGIELSYMLQRIAFKWVYQEYQFNQRAQQQSISIYQQPAKDNKTKTTLASVECVIPENDFSIEQGNLALSLGSHMGDGVNTTRFLGDLSANICTPTYLADFAQTMGEQYDCLSVKVKDEDEMRELGMDVLLSVGQGSKQEAKFIEIEYSPNNAKNDDTVVLVGKGVTFDTGGISIKPSANMDEMKYDMCGAATVFGTMSFLAQSKACHTRVVAIIPATENMPSDRATKPGDVFTSYSGQTVEVLNTDAEGRLILADALSYAEEHYKPKKMINIATLTGACIIALGNYRSAVMSNNDEFAKELMEVGQSVLDPCWQLPLDDEYDDLLHSNFADMANIGGRAAGSITAGCFLKRFVKNSTWAHLDIAGIAWLEGKKKGATGRPVPLLANWLLNHYS